eukprot:9117518-Prorocentrum_lima.AAC.1
MHGDCWQQMVVTPDSPLLRSMHMFQNRLGNMHHGLTGRAMLWLIHGQNLDCAPTKNCLAMQKKMQPLEASLKSLRT